MTPTVRNGRVLEGCTQRDYHSDPCDTPSLSASIGKRIVVESPIHAWMAHPKLGGALLKSEQSDAMTAGTIYHELVLGAGDSLAVVEADDFRTKAAREARDEALAAGRVPVLARKMADYERVTRKIKGGMQRLGIALPEAREQVVVFERNVPGTDRYVLCRSMLDAVDFDRRVIVDLKTCESANPRRLERAIFDFGYDIQRQTYSEAGAAVAGCYADEFDYTLVFAEITPPYSVVPVQLDGSYRALGKHRWELAATKWDSCLSKGVEPRHWPGYASGPLTLSPPAWAMETMMVDEEVA